ARLTVDLHRAGAALAGLAVPPAGQIRRLGGLQPVDDVEDDLAVVHLHLVVPQLTVLGVTAPDLEAPQHYDSSSAVKYFASSSRSNRAASSAGIGGFGCRSSRISSDPASEQTRLIPRHFGSMSGKSSRVWPPRASSRSSAARAVHSETSSMLRRSSARCQPGLYARPPLALTFATRCLSSSSLSSDSTSSSRRRMIPTSRCITSCSSCWSWYGVSPPSRVRGARAVSAAASTAAAGTVRRPAVRAYAAAYSPARLPNTSRSDSELPPSRLEPCMPPATSPAANSPVTDPMAAVVSASTSIPPMM